MHAQRASDVEYESVFDEEEIVESQRIVAEYNHLWNLGPQQLLKNPRKIARTMKSEAAGRCSPNCCCKILLMVILVMVAVLVVIVSLAFYFKKEIVELFLAVLPVRP